MKTILKWLTDFDKKQSVTGLFRLLTFIFAIVPVAAFENDFPHLLPVSVIIAVSSVYTVFKLAHPFRWYNSRVSYIVLTVTDMLVIVTLVHITGGLHSPFMLHVFTPVLTTSLLRPSRDTLMVGAIIGIYISYAVFFFPQLERVETIEHVSLASVYLMALASLSILPYAVNTFTSRLLKSAGMLEERRRLFRDMHDSLCQTIYGLRWELQMLQGEEGSVGIKNKLKELCELTEEAENEIRGSMKLLNSNPVEVSLISQFRNHLEELEKKRGIKYYLQTVEEPELDQSIKYELLEIFLEALRNVEKHSQASNVTVDMRSENGHFGVVISDDGKGFAGSKSRDQGLTSMAQRAESVGGWLRVSSNLGAGTSIMLEVPKQCPAERSAL